MRSSRTLRRMPEVAAVDQQVLAHGEIGVEVVHLRHDADADARLARRLRHRLADELDRAAVGIDQAEAAAQRRRLARAVGAEQREALAAPDRERQAAHDLELAVALAQVLHAQHLRAVERRRGVRRPARRPALPCRSRARAPRGHSDVTTRASCGSRPWKKWPQPGKDDDRQLLRARPREHVGERNDVVLLAVHDDRVRRHVLHGKAVDGGRRRAPGPRRARCCATRVCTNEPNEKPASATGSASPNRACDVTEHGERVLGLADAFVERARRLADAAKIEARRDVAHREERLGERLRRPCCRAFRPGADADGRPAQCRAALPVVR